jgi:hypothetical protein
MAMGLFQHFKSVLRSTTNLTGYIDTDAAEKAIRNNIYFRGPNVWILAIAIIIASIGLNVNSIPVVIGAMLISPLIVLYVFLQRYLVEGIERSGLTAE